MVLLCQNLNLHLNKSDGSFHLFQLYKLQSSFTLCTRPVYLSGLFFLCANLSLTPPSCVVQELCWNNQLYQVSSTANTLSKSIFLLQKQSTIDIQYQGSAVFLKATKENSPNLVWACQYLNYAVLVKSIYLTTKSKPSKNFLKSLKSRKQCKRLAIINILLQQW